MATPSLLRSILDASSSAAALDVQADAAPSDIRTAFRRRALQVHPDKCSDPQAAEAFRKLSEAYEELTSAPRSASAPRPAPMPRRSKEARRERSWADWEAELRRQEAAECAFLQLQSSRYTKRRTTGTLRKALQVCAELDERAGITHNPLLPAAEPQAAAAAPAVGAKRRRFSEEPSAGRRPSEEPRAKGRFSEEPGPSAPWEELHDGGSAAATATTATAGGDEGEPERRLLALLLYLREEHRYCLFCATRYSGAHDMERWCPGVLEGEHEDADTEAGGAGGGECDDDFDDGW